MKHRSPPGSSLVLFGLGSRFFDHLTRVLICPLVSPVQDLFSIKKAKADSITQKIMMELMMKMMSEVRKDVRVDLDIGCVFTKLILKASCWRCRCSQWPFPSALGHTPKHESATKK